LSRISRSFSVERYRSCRPSKRLGSMRYERRGNFTGEARSSWTRRLAYALAASRGGRLHHHHDVLELAEVAREFHVLLHVAGVLGQHVAPGGLEAHVLHGDHEAGDGEDEGEDHRHQRAPAGHPYEAA
jgi:hypothetical protein